MKPLPFTVPEKKRVRMIVVTDCKNEADDQFALTHHLLTPMFDVRGIIAAHFETEKQRYGEAGKTVYASFEEIEKIVNLLKLPQKPPIVIGAERPMPDAYTPVDSAGARMIISEAMKEDDLPLFVALLGAATDMASALLLKPEIANRLTMLWIGGGDYPDGGWEFNLAQDIHAVNILFSSQAQLWQVPRSTYKQMNVSLSELRYRVSVHGHIGAYLFQQMVNLNDSLGENPGFPHGESWCLGDQPTVGLLLEDKGKKSYDLLPAPKVDETFAYIQQSSNRLIRVYHTLDVRMTMEDFYAKLALYAMDHPDL